MAVSFNGHTCHINTDKFILLTERVSASQKRTVLHDVSNYENTLSLILCVIMRVKLYLVLYCTVKMYVKF